MWNRNNLKVNLALIGAVLIWSSAFVSIRLALESFSPGSVSFLRYFIATLCFFFVAPRAFLSLRLTWRHVPLLLCCGVLGLVGNSIFLNNSERSISAGLAAFMIAQTPVITSILAVAVLKEKLARITMLGIAVSCLGISIIFAGQSIEIQSNLGLFLVILATLCGSIHSITQKQLLTSLTPYFVTTVSTVIAAISLSPLLPRVVTEFQHATPVSIGAVIFLGVFASTIGQWLWSYGISKTLLVRASAYLYAMPILSTLFGWLILNEQTQTAGLIGGSVALLGAILIKKDVPKKSSPVAISGESSPPIPAKSPK